jgi:hypothetical protein
MKKQIEAELDDMGQSASVLSQANKTSTYCPRAAGTSGTAKSQEPQGFNPTVPLSHPLRARDVGHPPPDDFPDLPPFLDRRVS